MASTDVNTSWMRSSKVLDGFPVYATVEAISRMMLGVLVGEVKLYFPTSHEGAPSKSVSLWARSNSTYWGFQNLKFSWDFWNGSVVPVLEQASISKGNLSWRVNETDLRILMSFVRDRFAVGDDNG